MKIAEYNNLIESMYMGHEFSFGYKNKTYFLERIKDGYALYEISSLVTTEKVGKIICKINDPNLISLVNEFLEKKIFDGLSFNEIYDEVEISYIE